MFETKKQRLHRLYPSTATMDEREGGPSREPYVNFLKVMFVDFGLFIPLLSLGIIIQMEFMPSHRGFFCSDNSIKYPWKKETVGFVSLYLISLGFPIIFLGMGEILFAAEEDYEGDIHHHVGKWLVPKAFVRTWDIVASFLFGFLVCNLVTVASSIALGFMRPNFIAACNPTIDCNRLNGTHRDEYQVDFKCKNAHEGKYARMSFPSKHATLCFYSMVYVSVYLQKKVRWEYLSVFNNCMQVTFIATAWAVCITQITDNYHHMVDIVAGITIGSLVAWFNVCAVYNFFQTGVRMARGLSYL